MRKRSLSKEQVAVWWAAMKRHIENALLCLVAALACLGVGVLLGLAY